ncbi:MBL fold metallo-hydrolase, partial [Intestinimonas butyriciproducens]
MIVKTMPVGPIGTNCYLLGDETSKACAMIDPGGDPNEILSMIREAGLALKAILLTHGHYDHTGGVAGLEAAFPGTPVYLHRADAEGVNPTMFPPLPREVLRFYDEGDTVAVGGLTVEVLHTPGHSK